jgi:hypothetical protein
LGCEPAAVEGPYHISAVPAPKHPAGVGGVSIDRQLEKIRTFVAAAKPNFLQRLPVPDVLRGQEHKIIRVKIQDHNPGLGRLVPDDLGVAVLGADMSYHGIVFVLDPRSAAVVAVSDALGEGPGDRCVLAGGGVEGNEDIFFAGPQARGIVPVYHSRARKNCAELVRLDGIGQLFPVYEVFTYGVSPGHVSPIDAEGIVLKEQVIFPFIID